MKLPVLKIFTLLFALPLTNVMAVELLTAKELSSHCTHYEKDSKSLDGEFCARYIQGFIDGAVATDARVMINVEQQLQDRSSFEQRAMSTRAPSRGEYSRAARYAEFCLGNPVPLKEVVTHVANDLKATGSELSLTLAARDVVYSSLKAHYPCEAAD
ncbi:hypothetical protein GCM10011369_13990 [Neiella marina]|uniref:Rap1a immunity protein domain-containing protein n=1 Tax=Neiella marina TaxID=508461 RepID=A0A8J2XNM7_9GAMM|nr:Rap1a/Tai family immunity protein [Neiella marina]GGA73440.1 hypothetical protein GCM10011369_13990 [Neiella marina]